MSSTDQTRFRVFAGDRPGLPAGAVLEVSAATWPFTRHVIPRSTAAAIWIRDLHLAFPAGQTAGTRLVLTQSTYQLQRWLDWLDAHPDVQVLASGDPGVLAAEAAGRRGPWSRIEVRNPSQGTPASASSPSTELHDAFVQRDPRVRVGGCRRALETSPDDPALLLAFSSTCMELQLLEDAAMALDRALTVAADWEAVHFELGKLRLRTEDTEGAAEAFAAATRLMPTFAAAWSNLGAALGELGRDDEALDALQRALAVDPHGHTILNNIGAVHREAGRLDQAAAAFREAIALAPAFVFGYYNLGHTLFLEGDFPAARQAYEEGFARDPQTNARQACRLAVARTAAGDPDGAVALVEELRKGLPEERRRELFEEAESTLSALSAIAGIDAAAVTRVRAAMRPHSS